MEYFRDPKNQIQADIAYRLGHIALQYGNLDLRPDRFFPATLNLCILQNVLTHCVELARAMSRHERRSCFFIADLATAPCWGLHLDMVIRNTFPSSKLTVEDFLRHLRNALSHPTVTDSEAEYPSTGYTTIPDSSARVQAFFFVSSPDTCSSNPRTWSDSSSATKYLARERDTGGIPADVGIERNTNGRYSLHRNGSPYARIFAATLSEKELASLVRGICNHLAQPVQEAWDGETIARLVA